MNADTALGMPSQHKVLGRAIRRKNLQERSDAYERQHNLGNRTRAELENDVLERLSRNLAASELLLALFASSLASSRRSSICEPFPQFFNSTEGPRFEELTSQLREIPPLAKLVSETNLLRQLPLSQLRLLDWILCTEREGFTLRTLSVEEYLTRMSGQAPRRRQQTHALPTHVFELVYEDDFAAIREFESEKRQFGCLVGYHGSGLENFHSILRFGFDESFARSSSIYGEGIYLSEDLEVARSFLTLSQHETAGLKCLGDKLGVMASCEVIRHPQDVRHFGSPPPASATILDDSSTPLPKGYIVASSSKHVITRYLLVTSESTPRTSHAFRFWPSKSITQWLLVMFYLSLILAIWYYKGKSSRTADRFTARFMGR